MHTSKLAALGEMAGGVAHEINNPLAVIQLLSIQLGELIQRETIDRAKVERATASITQTTERIAKIVQGLRSFSRDGSSDPAAPVAVAGVLADTLSFCQERLRHRGVELRVPVISPALAARGRAVQISQVLLNLLNNASDALETASERWIEVSAAAAGGFVEIRVKNSGPPIPPEIRVRLFEPFFTTKGVGKGTGMGLGISLGIAKGHGGDLFLDPASPHTCFVVRLPSA